MTNDTKTIIGPHGIGGWLILPMLGLIGTILLTSYNLWQSLTALSYSDWVLLIEAQPFFVASSILSVIFGIIAVFIAIKIISLAYAYDIRTPKWFIGYLVYMAAIGTIDAALLYHFADVFNDPSFLDGEPRDTIRTFVSCAIWIPYFLHSKRVKNTFTKTYP